MINHHYDSRRVPAISYSDFRMLVVVATVLAVSFLLLFHSAVTSHGVPDDIFTSCVGGQVLDPVTHTCGGT